MNSLFYAVLALTAVCDKVDLSQTLVIAINNRSGKATVDFSRIASQEILPDRRKKVRKFVSVTLDGKSITIDPDSRPDSRIDVLKNNRRVLLVSKALFYLLNKGREMYIFEVKVDIKEKKSYVLFQPYPIILDNDLAFMFNELGDIIYP